MFLDRADVEATNYPAEQDIRIAVVNRKTCGGGNRTAKGAQAQSILMSVLQSCRHKGIRVIDIVTSILRAPDNTPRPLGQPRAVNNYVFCWSMTVDFQSVHCPIKAIGADPTIPHSYMPSMDLEELQLLDYDFVPETTHLLQIEKPEVCAALALEFLKNQGLV